MFMPKNADFSVAKRPIAYDVAEVAEQLRVPPGTIYREIRAGRLIARKVGKAYRIHPDCLDDYLKCPDQENPRASTNAQTRANGSSGTAAKTPGQDIAALAAARVLKKCSRATLEHA